MVSVIVLISVGIIIPLNNTILIPLGSEIRLQEKRGRYDPVGIIIPPNNTTLITLGSEIRLQEVVVVVVGHRDKYIGKKYGCPVHTLPPPTFPSGWLRARLSEIAPICSGCAQHSAATRPSAYANSMAWVARAMGVWSFGSATHKGCCARVKLWPTTP